MKKLLSLKAKVYTAYILSCLALTLAAGVAFYELHGHRYEFWVMVSRAEHGTIVTETGTRWMITVKTLGPVADYELKNVVIPNTPDKDWTGPAKLWSDWLTKGSSVTAPVLIHNGGYQPAKYQVYIKEPWQTEALYVSVPYPKISKWNIVWDKASIKYMQYQPLPKQYYNWVTISNQYPIVDGKTTSEVPVKISIPR